MALSWSLDKVGPLGLTADDCGLVLEAIAGADPLDPSAEDRPFRYEAEDRPDRRFRFGVLRAAVDVADADVRARFEEALDVLRTFGTVEDVDAARPCPTRRSRGRSCSPRRRAPSRASSRRCHSPS